MAVISRLGIGSSRRPEAGSAIGTVAKKAPNPAGPGLSEQRANRFMVIVLGLQRLSYIAPALASATSMAYRSSAVNLILLGLTVAWNVWMFWIVARRGFFAPWMAWVDLAWAALVTVVMLRNRPEGQGYGHWDWSGRVTQANGALLGVALVSLPAVLGAVALLVTVQATAVAAHTTGTFGVFPEFVGGLNGVIWFAIIGWFCLRYLRAQARRIDELTAARLAAESRRAAEQERRAVQVAHYRALHDTALATLTAIARGGLDLLVPQVRERCASDAQRVRRLLQDDPGGASTSLDANLTEVISTAEAIGLRVHYRRETAPADLPGEVIEALAGAAREALTNVAKHSGTKIAWLTVLRADRDLIVRVVDRGCGFEPDETAPGFGLRESITGRVRAVGGHVRIVSGPDEGTCVDIIWPAA